MCGLGVILRVGGGEIPDAWLDLLDARIAHRGPDGVGRFRDEVPASAAGPAMQVALVHRRLAIIDPGDGGQPMVSRRGPRDGDDLVAVVFNGCLYNHRQLREELRRHGHEFVTDHSDTEVLLHGHRQWGDALGDRLDGMYAYALWDRGQRRVLLGRDWFGEKPLYVARSTHGDETMLIAASDARVVASILQEATGSLATPPPAWLEGYLQLGYAPSNLTPYEGVTAVPPSLPSELRHPLPPDGDVIEAEARLTQAIDEAVAERLEADVPLGCFLSGGVDSSLVAHFAVQHRPDLATFSVRMPDTRYDESHHAELVASHLGTHHQTLDVAPDPLRDLEHLIGILGQPFGDSSILPTHWVSRAAREHVKVALSGDGADELFCGYERYLAATPLARFQSILRRLPARLGKGAHPKSAWSKLGRMGGMARDYPDTGVFALASIFGREHIARLLGCAPDHLLAATGDDPAASLRQVDLVSYLPGDLLVKVDTASMACALEVRAPFLDRQLARAAIMTPLEVLRTGGRKGLLRRIARRVLPASVVDRPKMGFAIPIGDWFRRDDHGFGTLLRDTLQCDHPFGSIELDEDEVSTLVDDHVSGRAEHATRLFTLLTLALWARSSE